MPVWMKKETTGKGWSEKDVSESLSKMNVPEHTGLDGMHPQVLRELADVIARPFFIVFYQLWQLGVLPGGKQMSVLTLRARRHRQTQVSFTSILEKVMEQLILKTVSRSIKVKKISRSVRNTLRENHPLSIC